MTVSTMMPSVTHLMLVLTHWKKDVVRIVFPSIPAALTVLPFCRPGITIHSDGVGPHHPTTNLRARTSEKVKFASSLNGEGTVVHSELPIDGFDMALHRVV